MKTLFSLSFLSIFVCSTLVAQNDDSLKDKLIISTGFNIGVGQWPISKNEFAYFDIGVLANLRYNFKTFSDQSAFGVDFSPGVGTFMNSETTAYLGFTFPLMASYNFGLGATNECENEYGFAVKAGLEFDAGPLTGVESSEFRSSIFYPAVQLNARFWKSGRSRVRDLSVRYGFLPSDRTRNNFIVYFSGKYFLDN